MNNPYFHEMLYDDGPIKREDIVREIERGVGRDKDLYQSIIEMIIHTARAYVMWSRTDAAQDYASKLERDFVAANEVVEDRDDDLVMYVIDNYESISNRKFKLMFYYAFNLLSMSNGYRD
jgi:hypothetical protein